MRSPLPSFLILLAFLAGCAVPPRKASVPARPAPLPPFEAPYLSEKDLQGLTIPRGLVRDKVSGQYAQKDVLDSYLRLKERAAQDGWNLILVSGYRSFASQRRVWNRYDRNFEGMGSLEEKDRVRVIMNTVSVPGLSRHHWGTDMDISERTLRGQLVKIQRDTPKKVLDFYTWMEQHAPAYGFCRVYQGKDGAVMDEPWHWSYFPFSKFYEKAFMRIRDFSGIMDPKVAHVEFLRRNFPGLLRKEISSVTNECSGR